MRRRREEEEEEEEEFVTFDEGEHLGVGDDSCLQVHLQSQEQSEEQLVLLVQTSGCVTVNLQTHTL